MPRPRKIPGEKSIQATFSLSDVEYEAIKKQAAEDHMSISEWLRGTAVAGLPSDPHSNDASAGASIPSSDP